MATVLESNKAKIARRVIEVLEFFDGNNSHATVMDIVRQYGRPQSSTSELLASLVDMGLLYKDARSRAYTPTPRLATFGSWAQPEMIRSGQLFSFMDRLAQSSRHTVALFGMVGVHAQAFRWSGGATPLPQPAMNGASERLSHSVAGQLLLSTLPTDEAGRLLRRLNAEAADDDKFNYGSMVERIQQFRRQGHATGESGFVGAVHMTGILLPRMEGKRPLVLAMIYPKDTVLDESALVATLRSGVDQCMNDRGHDPATLPVLMRAV